MLFYSTDTTTWTPPTPPPWAPQSPLRLSPESLSPSRQSLSVSLSLDLSFDLQISPSPCTLHSSRISLSLVSSLSLFVSSLFFFSISLCLYYSISPTVSLSLLSPFSQSLSRLSLFVSLDPNSSLSLRLSKPDSTNHNHILLTQYAHLRCSLTPKNIHGHTLNQTHESHIPMAHDKDTQPLDSQTYTYIYELWQQQKTTRTP